MDYTHKSEEQEEEEVFYRRLEDEKKMVKPGNSDNKGYNLLYMHLEHSKNTRCITPGSLLFLF